ncbi:MAG: C4-dicarboxylate ABC transporter permease [candidate division NC10 bacterium RIFCSPLOWO2_12_FULL_66_18]|nr:MAG: C4-dicarboxylate ABC transporter permease [candidate division NC10 bacterium RIFCSPLOWO2_12_FULL_66_18]
MILAIAIGFVVLGGLGMPLAFAIGLSALAGAVVGDLPLSLLPGKMVHSIDSFPLMAIPLFALAGQLMINGQIMDRLIDFANSIVGRIRGGLAHVTVIAALILSGVSGTAVADATALGGTIVPALSKAYGRPFAASVVGAAANLGPIIPPSAAFIVYAVMAGNVSIGGLFISGIVPGILLASGLMAMCSYLAHRRNYPYTGEPIDLGNIWLQTKRSFVVFMMPIVVVGGITAGAFTATEGAAIGVVYALVVGFFITRKLRVSHLPGALLNAGIVTAIVGALIAFASMVTYIFSVALLPQQLTELLRGLTQNPYAFVLLVNLLLLICGMFIEANAILVMLAPLLAPMASSYGIDPIYFGFLFSMNVVLGGITPPVGIILFVMSAMTRVPMTTLIANIWPFIIVSYGVLFLVSFVPPLVLFLPKAFGW